MKKEAIKRAMLGFPIGIAVSAILTLLISTGVGDGSYHAFAPELAEKFGSEINAAAAQILLSGLLGAGCAAASVIWEIASWSIVKQTGIFFLILFAMMMSVAYLLNWMEHSVRGFVLYFLMFLGVFVFSWITQYIVWKKKIRQLNEAMKKDSME